MGIVERVPGYVRALIPYPPGKPIEELEREYGISGSIKLASNECPIGPSPMAMDTVRENVEGLNIYPDGSGYYLKGKLAALHSLKRENVILGNGSNEIIELIARAFIGEGDEAVMSETAFIVYQIITDAAGGRKVVVPMKGYTHDLEAMAAALTERTKVVFVANPNNPTGTIAGKESLERFLDSIPEDVLIVMDEAYYEYAAPFDDFQEALPYLGGRENLIILRTFSKAYGLAGLRIGYGLAPEGVISILERVRQPFNVNSLALAAAETALDDIGHIKRGLDVNSAGMGFIYGELDRLGLKYVKSYANFVLFDTGRDGSAIYESLLKKGVIVRPMKGYGLPGHIRVTVGLPEENERFVLALSDVLASG